MATAKVLRLLFNYIVILSPLLMTSPTLSADVFYNSTLACTRGSERTPHNIDCKDTEPEGILALLFIRRVFYGTTPTSSGCNLTAPYKNCCQRDPDKEDCVFQDDSKLDEIVQICSRASSCQFEGTRLSSSVGNCSQEEYPYLTSFSFIEYECISKTLLRDITSDFSYGMQDEVYLDSNNFFRHPGVSNDSFRCIASTSCDSALTFTAIDVQLKNVNETLCAEELYFSDVKHLDIVSNVTCKDDKLIHDRVLFVSHSNAAEFILSVPGNHTGKVFIRVRASQETAKVTVTCGEKSDEAVTQVQKCPDDPVTPVPISSPSDTFTSTTTSSTIGVAVTSGGASSNNDGDDDDDIHPGTIAGIVLAIIAIVAVVILIIILLLHRRRNKPTDDNISVAPSTDEFPHYHTLSPETYSDLDSAYSSVNGDNVSNERRGQSNPTVAMAGLNPAYDLYEDANGFTTVRQLSQTEIKKAALTGPGPVVVYDNMHEDEDDTGSKK